VIDHGETAQRPSRFVDPSVASVAHTADPTNYH